MHILLSPSKTYLKVEPTNLISTTEPDFFPKQTNELIHLLGSYSQKELTKTLQLSDTLVELNFERYQNWTALESHPAGWYYRGETFFGLGAESLSEEYIKRANERLRVVSGLYGLLRITDEVKPYRLEMKTKFARGPKSLYEFWGPTLAQQLQSEGAELILVCASDEYMKAIRPHLVDSTEIITPKFLQYGPDGSLKSRMAFAKWSRGLLARWTIVNDAQTEEDLHAFDSEGYTYDPERSEPGKPVFIAPKNFTLKGKYKKT